MPVCDKRGQVYIVGFEPLHSSLQASQFHMVAIGYFIFLLIRNKRMDWLYSETSL